MKKYLFLPLAVLLFLLQGCCSDAQCGNQEKCKTENNCNNMCDKTSSADLAGIRKALDLYVQAAVAGDSKVARPAFAEGATISHAENDSLICLPIQALFDYYDQTGKHPASYEIADYSIAGDVAMVRIESKFGDAEFTDMFALVKEGADWKIVSKIFTVK